ncbi:MAG: hypothetical protein IJW49_05575 [Clostridia bacterium]|nr:hypothetical protein [Clostridia bacterium]
MDFILQSRISLINATAQLQTKRRENIFFIQVAGLVYHQPVRAGYHHAPALILKDEHYLGKGEFEAIQAVIQDAFWLDFTFFICYNKERICEETYRFAKFNEYVNGK